MTDAWDHSFDAVVVGSGNGGMTAALCLYEMGVTDVLLIEKGECYGGTSAISGGGVWIPNNRYAREAGADDSPEEARSYLEAVIPDMVPREMIRTYLEEGPRMIDFLHERTRVRYRTLDHYPDYFSDAPGAKGGHRSMEPEPIRATELGEEADRLTPLHHMMLVFGRLTITQEEAQVLMGRLRGWVGIMTRLLLGWLFDIPGRLRSKVSRRLTCGNAGVARLRLSLMERDIPLWLNTELTGVSTDDSGRVEGVTAKRDGHELRIRARRGVVLAAGGFEHDQAMREEYLPQPTSTEWSASVGLNTGTAIRAGQEAGGAMDPRDGAWWCTTLSVPGEPRPRLSIMEKSFPGSYVVNRAGKRFSNESQNYMSYVKELYEVHSDEEPCVPSFLIFDAKFRRKYIAGPLLTSDMQPDWMIPKRYYDEGFLTRAESIGELAEGAGIDREQLERTVERVNGFAREGKDHDFGRGDSEYDRYYGDPEVTPNPCLAPLDTPPYYAMVLYPGDFGTQGGLVTDTRARVKRRDGGVIEGLYATGNCAAAILPAYPGPGATLGPAMTFGYLAAKDIAGHEG